MKPFKVLAVLGVFALIVQLWSDTVGLRDIPGTTKGTFYIPGFGSQLFSNYSSIAKQANFPIEGKNNYRGVQPPPLPTNNLARLRWIDGDVYSLDWEAGDTILIPNKPTLIQTKSGKWQLSYPPQAP